MMLPTDLLEHVKSASRVLKHYRFRLLLMAFGLVSLVIGMLIVPIERFDPDANIHSLEDGVWWSVSTMSSVGYGDKYPVTSYGRLVGMALQVIGFVTSGMTVGYITTTLFRSKDEFYWKRVTIRVDELESKLDQVERKLDFLIRHQRKVRSGTIRSWKNPKA